MSGHALMAKNKFLDECFWGAFLCVIIYSFLKGIKVATELYLMIKAASTLNRIITAF